MGTCMALDTCACRVERGGGAAEIPRAAGAITIGSVGQITSNITMSVSVLEESQRKPNCHPETEDVDTKVLSVERMQS